MSGGVDVTVGQRLRRRRRLMGMTQAELGAVCGVTFQQIQKYECAASRLSVGMLWKLACVLEVDVSYFFMGLASDVSVYEGRRRRAAAQCAPAADRPEGPARADAA